MLKKFERLRFNFCLSLLIGFPRGIGSSAIGFKICAVSAVIKKYRSITKKQEQCMIKQYC